MIKHNIHNKWSDKWITRIILLQCTCLLENFGSWRSCGWYLNTGQVHPILPVPMAPSRMCPGSPQIPLGNDFMKMTKNPKLLSGLQTPIIPIQLHICGIRWKHANMSWCQVSQGTLRGPLSMIGQSCFVGMTATNTTSVESGESRGISIFLCVYTCDSGWGVYLCQHYQHGSTGEWKWRMSEHIWESMCICCACVFFFF